MKNEESASSLPQEKTEGCVKLRITPGSWMFDWATEDTYTVYVADLPHSDNRTIAYSGTYEREQNKANALFIAEAGTVANETGLMPREMKEQREELLRVLKPLVQACNKMSKQGAMNPAITTEAEAAILRATKGDK